MVERLAMRLEVTVNVRPLKPGRTADPLRPELSGPKATSEYEPVKRNELDRGRWPETKGDVDRSRRARQMLEERQIIKGQIMSPSTRRKCRMLCLQRHHRRVRSLSSRNAYIPNCDERRLMN